uniref:Dual oxidase 2 n=1 Tax=Scleropages formosus TaxID=113540 RepID=A0A8C9SR53_SCLFO
MTFYDGIYPFYPRQRTPFIFSLDLLTVILVFLVLAGTFCLILPGIRGKRLCSLTDVYHHASNSLAVNFSRDWATGGVKANTTYKSFSSAVVHADVGLWVGLSGINVTLKGDPVNQLNETINYNEMFQWTNILDEDYAEALERGLPSPILYIAEKFTLNSPCGLYHQYRYAGRYTSATLWTAFCCWLIANILFSMPVIFYAGCMMVTTGAFIFFSLASFATIQNIPPCNFTMGAVSMEAGFAKGTLGFAGLLCTLLGLLVVILDSVVPETLREAFGVSGDVEGEQPALGKQYLNPGFVEGKDINTHLHGDFKVSLSSRKVNLIL